MAEITQEELINIINSSESCELVGLDLSGLSLKNQNLSFLNLRNCNLSEVDLSESDLTDTNLEFSDLTGAVFNKTNCEKANFKGSNLSGAKISGSDFSNANLESTILCYIDGFLSYFNNARFQNCVCFQSNFCVCFFDECDMKSVDMNGFPRKHKTKIGINKFAEDDGTPFIYYDPHTPPSKITFVIFFMCSFEKTVFDQTRLDRTTFRECDFKEAAFINSDLNHVLFHSTGIQSSFFRETDLSTTRFISTDLERPSYGPETYSRTKTPERPWGPGYIKMKILDSDFSGCDISNSQFKHVKIANTDLSRTTFDNANFESVLIQNCDLSFSKFIDCQTNDVSIISSNLDSVTDNSGKIIGGNSA